MTLFQRDLENQEIGLEKGREEGRNEGREEAYYEMVRDGDISEEKAASKLSLAIDAFKEAYALWLKSQTSMV